MRAARLATCILDYMSTSEVVTVRVSGELGARLRALSDQTHRTKAFYARQALELHLDDLEDYYLAAQAAQRFHAGAEQPEDWGALCAEIEACAESAARVAG